MCPPDFFDIDYAINPWMDVAVKVDHARARREWQELVRAFESLGVTVEQIQPVKDLPDMVFTANGGIVQGSTFIRANFRYQERQGEEAYFESWFQEHGYEVKTLPSAIKFEGTGDVYPYQDILVCGYGFRSDKESHPLIADIFGKKFISLRLVDPEFYHMDISLCTLGEKGLLYYPGAFDDESNKTIQELGNVIPLNKDEAHHFVGNSVYIGDTLIAGWMNNRIKTLLEQKGIKVCVVTLSEFLKSGGGVHCLKLWI